MINFKIHPRIFDIKIAECIGLWLAEGDTKTKKEITFTNNQFDLIELFHKTLTLLFDDFEYNTRLYVYMPTKNKVYKKINVNTLRKYIDKRANKPYYIWRLASIKIHNIWVKKVEEFKLNTNFYVPLLRGFFAGEGNIKTGSHGNRTLRIAQLKNTFVEHLLNAVGITLIIKKIKGHIV